MMRVSGWLVGVPLGWVGCDEGEIKETRRTGWGSMRRV